MRGPTANRHRLTDVLYIGRSVDDRKMAYDNSGKLISVDYPNDPGTNRRVVNAYDKLDRLISEQNNGETTSYGYDKSNNRVSTTYVATGTQIVSTFDAGNRMDKCIETPLAGAPRITEFRYDLNGLSVHKALPNHVEETEVRDAQSRPLSCVYSDTEGETYRCDMQYDTAGNLMEMEEKWPGGTLPDRVVTNSYDRTYRLLEERIVTAGEPGSKITGYGYDNANNRVTKTTNGNPCGNGATTCQYGDGTDGFSANQLKAQILPDNTQITYTYDDDGNRISRTEGGNTDTYNYDYSNRLLNLDYHTGSESAVNGIYQYSYDHRTRRLSRDERGAITDVIYSGGVSVIEKARATNQVEVEFVRAPGLGEGGPVRSLLYSNRGGQISVSAMNARGDVTAKITPAENVGYGYGYGGYGYGGYGSSENVVSYESAYKAFGDISREAGETEDRQKANTKEQDPHGLINDGFRYRDAETGSFITRDPAGFVDGPNLYTYVRQNPWSKFDPLGLETGVAKYSHDEALRRASMASFHRANENPGGTPKISIEYASNTFYDPKSRKHGYTEPYTDNKRSSVSIDKKNIPQDTEFSGAGHNHTTNFSDPTKFSVKPNEDGASDVVWSNVNEKPLGLAAYDKNTDKVIVKKHEPTEGSRQRSRLSQANREEVGAITQWNPETNSFGPVPEPSASPRTPAGLNSRFEGNQEFIILPEGGEVPKRLLYPRSDIKVEKPTKMSNDDLKKTFEN
ncbi:MAG: hypothetical protein P1V20_29670 [Verrucomicrobiales bacterium]|nr:hypothetical protein [Verrucomicrobiales bacterium]